MHDSPGLLLYSAALALVRRRVIRGEDARDVRYQQREALETIRQERERLRDTAETARAANEQNRCAAEAARYAVVDDVRATADTLNATLEHMKVVEEMRRTGHAAAEMALAVG